MTSTVLARMYFFAAGNEGAGVDARVDAILDFIGMVADRRAVRVYPRLGFARVKTAQVPGAWLPVVQISFFAKELK